MPGLACCTVACIQLFQAATGLEDTCNKNIKQRIFLSRRIAEMGSECYVTACTHLRKNVSKVPSSTNVKKRKNITKPQHTTLNKHQSTYLQIHSCCTYSAHTRRQRRQTFYISQIFVFVIKILTIPTKTWTTLQTDATSLHRLLSRC